MNDQSHHSYQRTIVLSTDAHCYDEAESSSPQQSPG